MFSPFEFTINELGQPIELPQNSQLQPIAVGILWQSDNFLLTSRPVGKVYADYWEFPGGKVEKGETILEALKRELQEELNIQVISAEEWKFLDVQYPHATVRLYFYNVFRWNGKLKPLEKQQISWQKFPVTVTPILPGTVPILAKLAKSINN